MAYASQNWTKDLLGRTLKSAQEQGLIGSGNGGNNLLFKFTPEFNKVSSHSVNGTNVAISTYTALENCIVGVAILSGNAKETGNCYDREITIETIGTKIFEYDNKEEINYSGAVHFEFYKLLKGQKITSSGKMTKGNTQCELTNTIYVMTNASELANVETIFWGHNTNATKLENNYVVPEDGYVCFFRLSSYGGGNTSGLNRFTDGGILIKESTVFPTIVTGYATNVISEIYKVNKGETISTSQYNKDTSYSRHVLLEMFIKDKDITLKVPNNINYTAPFEDYSEEEKVIGRWTNGKPIYRKCYSLGNISLKNGENIITIPDKDIFSQLIKCFILRENEIPSMIPCEAYVYNNNFYITLIDNMGASGDKTLILEYTKTTDLENSFNPSLISKMPEFKKYSTNEQVIGEWIDGKPIYRKVIVANVSISTIKASGFQTGIQNGGILLKSTFLGTEASGVKWTMDETNRAVWFSNDLSTAYTDNNYNGTITHVIIEYTKTTD